MVPETGRFGAGKPGFLEMGPFQGARQQEMGTFCVFGGYPPSWAEFGGLTPQFGRFQAGLGRF